MTSGGAVVIDGAMPCAGGAPPVALDGLGVAATSGNESCGVLAASTPDGGVTADGASCMPTLGIVPIGLGKLSDGEPAGCGANPPWIADVTVDGKP